MIGTRGDIVKIWYQSALNFDQHPNYEEVLAAHLDRVASPGTEVILSDRSSGFGREIDRAEFAGSFDAYRAVVAPEFMKSLLTAEAVGAEAFVAASFSEPNLTELRSAAHIPITSMAEASLMAAFMDAPTVGLITLRKGFVRAVEQSILSHHVHDHLRGVHPLEGDISEIELDANLASPGPYLDRLVAAVRDAIAAGARAVIPAGGLLGLLAAENGLQEVDGVPVIDSVGAPVLFAELAVTLKARTGAARGDGGYPAVPGARRLPVAG